MDELLGACSNPNYSAANPIFSALFQVLVAATCNLTRQNVWPEDYGPKLLTESKRFDYIVIGAGSAGSTIAGRLSEDSNKRVLLLEAGEDPPLVAMIPGLFLNFQKTKYDWEYYAEQSATHSLEIDNGRTYIPRGKLLGGCSSTNGMLYIRGNRKDYDSWEAKGNTGWGYDSVLKYFKKTENLQSKELLESDQGKYHGTTGEMMVVSYPGNLSSYLIIAATEMGYDFRTDVNVENNFGFYKVQGNIDNGFRCSPATAFLKEEKDNLFIVKNAMASKVLIDKVQKQATGVEFINSKGETISVNASREVIVSAGALNSPQLLMLSGIGPAKQLQKLKIPVIADLPVGLNLQDHFTVPCILTLPNDKAAFIKTDDVDSLYNYLMHKTGPLAGSLDLVGFVNTVNKTGKYPNLEVFFLYYKKGDINFKQDIMLAYGYSEDFIKSIEGANKKSSICIIALSLLNPKSVGEVKLRSSDPLEKPIINLNYLEKKEDVDVMLQAVKFVQEFIKMSTMKKMGATLLRPFLNRCKGMEFTSDKYWICYIRSIGKPGHHFAGSVKMGPVGDRNAVVSPELKVHGVKGLRIADASIMPNVVSGNTAAAAVMIGEKAADMIRSDLK